MKVRSKKKAIHYSHGNQFRYHQYHNHNHLIILFLLDYQFHHFYVAPYQYILSETLDNIFIFIFLYQLIGFEGQYNAKYHRNSTKKQYSGLYVPFFFIVYQFHQSNIGFLSHFFLLVWMHYQTHSHQNKFYSLNLPLSLVETYISTNPIIRFYSFSLIINFVTVM